MTTWVSPTIFRHCWKKPQPKLAGQRGLSWFKLVSQTDQLTSAQNSAKTNTHTMLGKLPSSQAVLPQNIIFYIPLNTGSVYPPYTNCIGIKHSLTPWCGGEECPSRGLTVTVWELGPVFEVQDTRGNGAALALLRVAGHRGWKALKTPSEHDYM